MKDRMQNTLIIDSSSDKLYVILVLGEGEGGGRVVAFNSLAERTKHSEIIHVKIAEALKVCPLLEISCIAVNVGPGSFTGIRVGIAAALGLNASPTGEAANADKKDFSSKKNPAHINIQNGQCIKKLIEVNAHEVLSFFFDGEVDTFIPANGGQFYYSRARRGVCLSEPVLIKQQIGCDEHKALLAPDAHLASNLEIKDGLIKRQGLNEEAPECSEPTAPHKEGEKQQAANNKRQTDVNPQVVILTPETDCTDALVKAVINKIGRKQFVQTFTPLYIQRPQVENEIISKKPDGTTYERPIVRKFPKEETL